ncbi:MAG: YqaE/Pmp3 family membrane protein [Nitrospiraceae bacterium]|nr:MAG: YqaE/Pmp3 family membrane protein [Nitrospiraceae bacterium]
MTFIKVILAIILPPACAFLQVGLGFHFWINILLTLLGVVPGMIHAIWLLARKRK